jgi:hypothetical protein
MNTERKKNWIVCSKCGKKLIERLPNGLLKFIFGKSDFERPPVDIEIHGSIKMKCLKRSCDQINIINFFPNVIKHFPAKEIESNRPAEAQSTSDG